MATKLPRALLLLILASIPFRPSQVLAHAIVVASSPAPRQTVATSELKIALRFNSRVDRSRSRLVLMRPGGAQETLAIKEGGVGETIETEAKALEKGGHRLLWQTLSLDGHVTHGEIPFEADR
jgi:methionine-rich copper-binding protein CopC